MLENDRMETASTEVTLIWRRNNIEKSTWRTQWYFVDFESWFHVEISTLNRCHNFHVDSPFKINVISTNFPRGISTSNRWRINGDVSIGKLLFWFAKDKHWVEIKYPVGTGRKLNVRKTFRRHSGRLLNVLCTFNLRPVSAG